MRTCDEIELKQNFDDDDDDIELATRDHRRAPYGHG